MLRGGGAFASGMMIVSRFISQRSQAVLDYLLNAGSRNGIFVLPTVVFSCLFTFCNSAAREAAVAAVGGRRGGGGGRDGGRRR